MAGSKEDKRRAKELYVFQRMTQETIAEELGVSSATIGRWKSQALQNGDDWNKARQSSLVAGEGLDAVMMHTAEKFVLLSSEVTDLLSNLKSEDASIDDVQKAVSSMASLADSTHKMTTAAGKLAPKISKLAVAQDVIEFLIEHVQEECPEHGAILLEILEPFGKKVAEVYQ